MSVVEVTYSELDSFATCPFQWWKRYVELKRPKQKSVKLSFGAAIHQGIETFYGRSGNALEVVQTYCNKVREEAQRDGLTLDEEYELTLKKATYVMEAYLTRYAGDFDKYNIMSVEPKFRIPLCTHKGQKIVICGKVDRITVEKHSGLFLPVETKTAASWNPDINRLMLDFQISVYAWAISKMLKLHDVTFLYDVIRKPAIRQKKDESVEEFLNRVKAEMTEKPDEYFFRDKITRSREEIERTEVEIMIRAKELVERRKDRKVYRKPGDHCFWKCSYMKPCLDPNNIELENTLYETVQVPHEELVAD